MSLTDDEYTCLAICGQGESLAAIGRWKPSLERLAARGFVHCHDVANHVITEAGRKALQEREAEDDEALTKVIRKSLGFRNAQFQAQQEAEAAAQALARAAKASTYETGDTVNVALLKWRDTVMLRAKDILDEQDGPGRPLLR